MNILSLRESAVVELYDLSITERKDDRFGRVATNKSMDEDDLIAIAFIKTFFNNYCIAVLN